MIPAARLCEGGRYRLRRERSCHVGGDAERDQLLEQFPVSPVWRDIAGKRAVSTAEGRPVLEPCRGGSKVDIPVLAVEPNLGMRARARTYTTLLAYGETERNKGAK